MKHHHSAAIKYIAKIGVLSAVAAILMLFEFPLWFAPGFYKLDLSETVILIGGFALGPVAGVLIELLKNLLNLLIKFALAIAKVGGSDNTLSAAFGDGAGNGAFMFRDQIRVSLKKIDCSLATTHATKLNIGAHVVIIGGKRAIERN